MNQGLYSLPPQELRRNLEDLLNSEPELAYTNPEPFKSEKIMDSNHYSEEQYHLNHEFNINLSRRHSYKKLKDSPTRFNQARYRSSSNDASNYVKNLDLAQPYHKKSHRLDSKRAGNDIHSRYYMFLMHPTTPTRLENRSISPLHQKPQDYRNSTSAVRDSIALSTINYIEIVKEKAASNLPKSNLVAINNQPLKRSTRRLESLGHLLSHRPIATDENNEVNQAIGQMEDTFITKSTYRSSLENNSTGQQDLSPVLKENLNIASKSNAIAILQAAADAHLKDTSLPIPKSQIKKQIELVKIKEQRSTSVVHQRSSSIQQCVSPLNKDSLKESNLEVLSILSATRKSQIYKSARVTSLTPIKSRNSSSGVVDPNYNVDKRLSVYPHLSNAANMDDRWGYHQPEKIQPVRATHEGQRINKQQNEQKLNSKQKFDMLINDLDVSWRFREIHGMIKKSRKGTIGNKKVTWDTE